MGIEKKRIFVDRNECIDAFRKNLLNSAVRDYNILVYYGISGIGKTRLLNKLQDILNEEYPQVVWTAIDLNAKTYREVSTFLVALRDKIQEKYKVEFYLFNIVHAIYWKKLTLKAFCIKMITVV